MANKNAMSKIALRSAVDSVVQQANSRGISVTTDELMKIVKTHAAGATASIVAGGLIPGVGSGIAAGIEIGFVWSMYYRLCTKLGINAKKEVLKSLGSAFISNIATGVAGALVVSIILSFIPGIGWLSAAALLGLEGYCVTYYSGVIFMNLLVRVFKAGKSLEDMELDQMKAMMKDVTKTVTFSSVKDEATQAYKNRKQDGVAEVIQDEDDTTAFIPVKPLHTYWLHLGIDFGSTNSVMAWRLYKWTEVDGWQLDPQNNKSKNIVLCPTMVVYKRDNMEHPVVQAEPEEVIVGKRAEDLAIDNQYPAVAHTNFKLAFYDAAEGSEEQRQATELIGLFMGHLYQLYQSEILGCLPNHVLEDMSSTIHLSTPVRAEKIHRDRMAELAEKAGFRHDGKSHFIDTSRNEAECVMHLTVDANMSNLQRLIQMSNAKSALNLLFIDVGGSTTDIELIKQEMHSAGKSTQVLAMWPRENVQYMLGGREVDRAIFDYLVEEGYLIPHFANECWDHGTGKTLFRKLKEQNNEVLRSGKKIADLGTIRTACGDPDEEEKPRNKYSDHKITREVFEQRICANYIDNLCTALHDVLKDKVGEDEVDAVFVTGAGSKLYFIHDLLLGRYGSKPLKLTQLQQDESRLFDQYRDPATCCAEGAISGVM